MATEIESAVQDRDRLDALRRTGLLDSAPEECFDRLTRLASRFLGVPIALISLVDEKREFFKSCVGLPEPWASERETPLSRSFCQHVVNRAEPLIVEDAREHPLVWDNLAIPDLGVIAYAGIPLVTSDGQVLGSFCAIDSQPRKWTEAEIQTLRDLTGAVSTEIELRTLVRDTADEIRKTASAGAESEAARQQVTRILESIADAFFAVDRDWRVTYMNQEAEVLLHRHRDELIGKNLWEEFPEAVGSTFYDQYRRAVEQGETVQFEEFFPPLDTWFEVRAYPSEDGLSVYFRNVNERRRTEEILRESERKLEEQNYLTRTITDNATVGMFMMDVKGHATFMNPAAEEMTGYTLDEIRDMPLHDAVHHTHPDGTPYPMSECPIDRALPENNDMRAHHDIFVRKDGTFVPVTVAARPILRDGNPIGTVVEVRDVTDEQRAENALRWSERRFRSLVQATSAIVWDTSPSGEFGGDQPGWSTFTGQTQCEYEGWGWLDAIHPDDRSHTAQSWKGALQTRTMYAVEHRVRRQDGEYRHMLVRAVPLLDESEQILEWVGVHTDITERKESEERQRFLAEAGALLSSSLDYQTTLASVARSAVPTLADWCAIDIIGDDDTVQRVEVAHPDPARRELALEIQRRYPPDPNANVGLPHVLRTGEPEMVSDIPDELLEIAAQDATHLRMIRELGLHSYIVVPMIARGRTLGAITLIYAESGRRYGPADLETARELALRSAFAVDNARLFGGLERLIRELDLQRARLAELFREAPAIIATTRGSNHVFEMANPPYLQLIGDRDILGKPVAEAVPEVVEQGFLALLDQVYSSGESFLGNEVPVFLQRASGAPPEERFVNFVYQPVREVDGAVGGIFVHGVDVTDQVRARQQVERLEERLRLALEAADVGTYDWDVASGVLNWDPRARRIFGVPSEGEVSYDLFLERLHPEDKEVADRLIQETLDPAGSGEFSTEYRIIQPDLTLRWVRALGRVYFEGEDSSRRAVRFLGTVQDITPQRQLQQQLETERVRLREVFQQAPAMIAVLRGPQHIFEIANPPYLALVGRRDVLGKPIRGAIPEIEGQGFFEMLDGVYRTGEPVVGDEERALLDRTGDGVLQEGYFNFVFHPLREEDGAVGGILIHAVEVTEQVRARQEVERKAEELARTARALEATNRELDQFAYVASHDLKAPLRGIANLSQWIEEDIADALSEENRQQMNLLRGRVHRMEGLIEGILQYSRAGRVTGKPEQVDLGVFVREVTELLDPPENFTVHVAEDLPTLETERLPLQQVLMNLIGNAIKYTDRPDARVEVAAHDAGEFVEFAVADNGPGIAPEYHEKIFAIFQRLEARDQVEGTGIGLSLVKKIVEGRGGRVWVESQEGQGTTFRFTWPKMPERTF